LLTKSKRKTMKTLFLGMLLLANNSIVNGKINHHVLKNTSPVSTLKVDAAQSLVSWHIAKLTGTHTGTLKVFLGQLTVQRKKLTGGWVLIDMTTLEVTDLSQPDKQKLETNLKSDNFFDTGRYTVARFDITEVNYSTTRDSSTATISGNLTMHGVSKKINFIAGILKNSGDELIARADVNINRRDWNIATENFKYNHFISPIIAMHILLKTSLSKSS
jgi:polyisoprenoid-binding protein YceI